MEQRWNERFSARKDVGIEFPGGRTLIGQTRNISYRGMFVEIDMANLPVHALVQLLLPIRGADPKAYLRVPAAISRYAQEGLALVYCGNYAPLLKYVRAWSEQKKKTKHQSGIGTEPLRPKGSTDA
jgi:hypothetical protein